jgi:hypothetical protein
MLEVNLQDKTIEFFKMTCRNVLYYEDGSVMAKHYYKKGNLFSTIVHGKIHAVDIYTLPYENEWGKGLYARS